MWSFQQTDLKLIKEHLYFFLRIMLYNHVCVFSWVLQCLSTEIENCDIIFLSGLDILMRKPDTRWAGQLADLIQALHYHY